MKLLSPELHPQHSRLRNQGTWRCIAVMLPLLMGVAVFGWRCAGSIIVVSLAGLFSTLLWRYVGRRGRLLSYGAIFYQSLLLCLLMPAHLLSAHLPWLPDAAPAWPLLVAAPLIMVMLSWLLGGSYASALSTPALTVLALTLIFPEYLQPQAVLFPSRVVSGDLLSVAPSPRGAASNERWSEIHRTPGFDALLQRPADDVLTRYTHGEVPNDGFAVSLEVVIRDLLPPIVDLIQGAHPTTMGGSAAVVVIVGGLLLMYRGLSNHRIPLTAMLAAYATLMIIPTPVQVSSEGIDARWIVGRSAGWVMGLTFVHYQLLASPLLICAFFLATAPSVRPANPRAEIVVGLLLGVGAAILQLRLNAAAGPLLALVLVGLVAPALDRLLPRRPLV